MTSNTVDTVDTASLPVDDLHVVEPRAAGLDVHKMCITAAVRLYEAATGVARSAVSPCLPTVDRRHFRINDLR